jgi:hypothetical protein
MIESNFESIVNALGMRESEVSGSLALLPEMKAPIVDESFYYTYYPEDGVEFGFDVESSRFIKVHVKLRASRVGGKQYVGTPPLGVSTEWNRDQAIATLGTPTRSWPPATLPVIGARGGSDSFAMPDHPDLGLFLNYTAAGEVRQISVMHKDRPT